MDWPEFVPGARELFNSLDDKDEIYHAPRASIMPDGPQTVFSAADELEVGGPVVALLQSVNEVAKVLGIRTECVGGGSGRSASFTNLVMRRTGELTASTPACISWGMGRSRGIGNSPWSVERLYKGLSMIPTGSGLFCRHSSRWEYSRANRYTSPCRVICRCGLLNRDIV